MKLYLSSMSLGDESSELQAMVDDPKEVLIVGNALDNFPEARSDFLASETEVLTRLGFSVRELDLRGYFGARDLAAVLAKANLVWVNGGNTFLLRRAMRQSGFDVAAPPLIRSGQLTYGGFSAGAVAATPTLRGIEFLDMPGARAEGYDPAIIWEGLGLTDFSILPHFSPDHPDYAEALKSRDYFEQNKMPYKAIRDGEVVVVGG